jgi:hypothetical protein
MRMQELGMKREVAAQNILEREKVPNSLFYIEQCSSTAFTTGSFFPERPGSEMDKFAFKRNGRAL